MATSVTNPSPELIDQVAVGITKATSLYPSSTWISSLLPTLRAAPPPVLIKTASFRLLTTDFTTSLSLPQTPTFPSTIHDASLPERVLPAGRPIPVQVVGVEDLGRSKMEQIEALEAVERGETKRGRELIRVVREEGEERGHGGEEERTAGPCRLILQDAAGVRVYGIELKPVEGIKLGMFIGTKVCFCPWIKEKDIYSLAPILIN
jgi:RecQ-mediated genome instability protein 1